MSDNPNPGAPGQGAAPEATQDKPKTWWEARGFKTEQEALDAWESAQRDLTEKNQRLAAAERTIQAIVTAKPKDEETKTRQPGYRRYFEGNSLEDAYNSGDVHRFTETLMSGVEKAIRERAAGIYEEQESLRAIREEFFRQNRDLSAYPELVKMYGQEVAAENPNMTVKDAMSEIAKRTRARVAAIKKGEGTPNPAPNPPTKPNEPLPHTGPGDGAAPTPTPTPKTQEPTDDVDAEIRRRLAERQKKLVR